jgi:hypothetical protein
MGYWGLAIKAAKTGRAHTAMYFTRPGDIISERANGSSGASTSTVQQGPLTAFTNDHGRYMTVTPELTFASVGEFPLNI